MKVLFVSAEVSPFAKVGGLADVAGSLPKALRNLGHDARVVMPLYQMIEDDPRWNLAETLDEYEVRMSRSWSKLASFKETELDGLPVGFIGTDEWFTKAISSETVYQPGGMQHLFFAAAVLRAMEELNWIPDVVHCNDWHTGFLPVLMREKYGANWADVASIFTIHNLAYQGEFGTEILDALDLHHGLFHPEKVEAWGRVNFLKAGCAYSDRVNTVSPTYAEEIQTAEYGATLEGLMRHLDRLGLLSGILNGIDTEVFDPSTDPFLPANYSAAETHGKSICRAELLQELDLPPVEGAPLLGVVSRMSSQKGMDLLLDVSEQIFKLPAQLVIQGLGDPELVHAFQRLEKQHPRHFKFINQFDAALAQRVYAGCDGFLMPSAFEPCGLGQMIALRYGTVPLVRSTGGLADTIFEGENGFVFHQKSSHELLWAVERLKATFDEPRRWKDLQLRGMKQDFSWSASAAEYSALYRSAVKDREAVALTA